MEQETTQEIQEEPKERKIVIPGEVVVRGSDYLPGEWAEKRGDEIISLKFGLVEESNKLIKIIPVSGPYHPRRGNVIIGKVENITANGWIIDVGLADNAFLSVSEVPRYVNRGELDQVFDFGDTVVAKIAFIGDRGIDLTVKMRGLGKVDEGIIMKINSNKVPRVIGKEGSMVNVIKEATGCNITVGQNGFIWIKGDSFEKEMNAKKAVTFITENIFIHGLTEKVKEMLEAEK